ncbi:hypothetical protein [Desulfovibrio sp. TomC]|uniref:hypothetical protein n=1 Tax=Desulfovibrio sp. TomC TaxID=1562888 RepID=UPI0005B9B224|nr:hypothetical protein [Desulfovibrio sp. TomC]
MIDTIFHHMPSDPFDSLVYLLDYYDNNTLVKYDEELDFFNLLATVLKHSDLDIDISINDYSAVSYELSEAVLFVKRKVSEIRVKEAFDLHQTGKIIPKETINLIQETINSLRKEIKETTDYDDEHKRRLLEKLELLQKELHKKIPNREVLFSGIAKFGILLHEFGVNTKPLTDNAVRLMESLGKLFESIWKMDSDLPSLSSAQRKFLSLESEKTNTEQ